MSPNRLAEATSPYLLQHADNPVDWYEWGEEAFERARSEDRPVLLSVGYAACHWCHVMAHESFESPETAALMNERFVNIKVDREERPDVDGIYMDAVQAMTGQGGWPMTVFLTPDGEPFYAGTYFPDRDRHGMPAFRRVLEAVSDAWRDRRDELLQQGQQVGRSVARSSFLRDSGEPLSEQVVAEAHSGLRQQFDPEFGGLGNAPKFPQPMSIEFLLRCNLRGYDGALDMVTRTLDRMAAGGIYDQIGGGFHRYSVDRVWLVPHFEKMLYDNAQLARLYLHGFQVTGDETYRRVVNETLDYLLGEMRHPDGGFFSSQDADSEGEVPEERRRLLFERREKREHPATDEKVLASWNGLAIQALAEAGRALSRPDYVEAAERAADFVLSALRREDGRLLRGWRDGRTSGPAHLDDHALMAAGCLELYQATFDLRWFEDARDLARRTVDLFADPDGGAFFQTGSDAKALVILPKELLDNAVPSGNSVAAEVLQRVARL